MNKTVQVKDVASDRSGKTEYGPKGSCSGSEVSI